jgi:hypothetical protein
MRAKLFVTLPHALQANATSREAARNWSILS